MWEVTDVDDMVLRNLDWTGNEGIDNMMGIYIQHSAIRFIEYFKEKRPLATLSAANTRAALLAVSPKRTALQKRAAENIAKSASKMKARAIKKSGVNHFDVDGIGAAPIQTDKGAGATDWNAVKTDGVQKAAPAAETYAVKDAAEKFGKIFGRDVSRKGSMNYTDLLKKSAFNDELEK
jgi:hypothetical protein